MDALKRVACQVQVLFGPDNVDLLPVIERLADEGNVHEAEHGDVATGQLFGSTESRLGLPIEGTLPEDRPEQAAVWQVALDVVQDLGLGVRGTANDHDVRAGNDITSLIRASIDATGHFSAVLPV